MSIKQFSHIIMYNNQMNIRQKVTIHDRVFSQIIDDEMVLLDTQSEAYFGLDAIGCEMWKQLEKNPSLEALKTYMLSHYEVEASQLSQDMAHFIDHLVKNKLIEIG